MTVQAIHNGVAKTRKYGTVMATPRRRFFVSVRLDRHRSPSRYHVDFWNHARVVSQAVGRPKG
jgi:hypothetical protein